MNPILSPAWSMRHWSIIGRGHSTARPSINASLKINILLNMLEPKGPSWDGCWNLDADRRPGQRRCLRPVQDACGHSCAEHSQDLRPP